MTVLVTGGAGFIGSHVAARLLAQDCPVVILDNFNTHYDPALKRRNIERLGKPQHLTVIEGDIRDADLVKRIFADYGVRKVAHMAGMANQRASIHNAPLYVDVNIVGGTNLYEAARANDVEQFVLASTSSVYGRTERIPFTEDDSADQPLASYPASKRAMEMLGHTYTNLFNMNVTVLRFFNVYGPAGRPDMMPLRLLNAAFDGTEIPLFNNGDIHRDWTYIDDTIDGVLTALNCPLGYEVINLGFGSPVLLRDFVDIIEAYTGRKLNLKPTPAPLSEPPITYCNNDKARRLLNFDPQTDLKTGLKQTWDWFRAENGL